MMWPRLMAMINESKEAKQSKEEKTFWQVPENVHDVAKPCAFLPCIFIRRPESIVALLQKDVPCIFISIANFTNDSHALCLSCC